MISKDDSPLQYCQWDIEQLPSKKDIIMLSV